MDIFVCNSIGHVAGDIKIEQQEDGTWVATRPIGSVFGHDVDGLHTGHGKTKEDAVSALNKDILEFDEMMWL